jgi:chondroitin 4-sulfotransferase 11
MPISHKHKIIFIHVPKNAGTSITSLIDFSFEDTKNAHRTAGLTKAMFPGLWGEYTKYSIVRNPWDRFISNFEYAKMEKSYWHSTDGTTKYAEHPDFQLVKSLNFEEVVNLAFEHLPALEHPGWLPQKHFLCDSNNKVLVDKVFYSEKLDTDKEFKSVFPGVQKINVSNRKSQNYRDYYNNKTFYKIYQLYLADIELFGFKY